MLNTAMKGSKESCQGQGRVEWHKVRKGFIEEVFLSILSKMSSAEKRQGEEEK